MSKVEYLWRWCKRKPKAAALIALSTLSTAAALVLLPVILVAQARLTATQNIAQEAQKTERIQQYYSLVNRARESTLATRPGWTWTSLKDLRQAAELPTAVHDEVELRSLAAACLVGVDLRKIAVRAPGMNAHCLAFSPDGKRLAIGKGKGVVVCSVLLFDLDNRKLIWELTFPSPWRTNQTGVRALAFSPDGNRLVAGTRGGDIHVWDLSQKTPKPVTRRGHSAEVSRLAFWGDGKLLLSGSYDGTLKVWEAAEWKQVASYNLGTKINDMAVSSDGKLLA